MTTDSQHVLPGRKRSDAAARGELQVPVARSCPLLAAAANQSHSARLRRFNFRSVGVDTEAASERKSCPLPESSGKSIAAAARYANQDAAAEELASVMLLLLLNRTEPNRGQLLPKGFAH